MTIDRLEVLWTDEERRRRHPLGELRREHGKFHFHYVDISEAKQHGFESLPEFADVHRQYSSDRLFATFAERIPSVRRPDRVRILRSLRLIEPADDFEILARSGGALATDRVELVERRLVGDLFERPLAFTVAGTRHHPQTRPLEPDEELTVDRHHGNDHDAFACKLVRSTGECAGFIPRAVSEAVAAALDAGVVLRVRLLRSMPDARQQERKWVALLQAVADDA